MALPITITYTFATATGPIPLSQLDADFTLVTSTINGLGDGTTALATPTISTSAKYNGSTSGYTTLQASAVAGATTLTLPSATDTLVGKATTDTLTNKTINLASNTLTATSAQLASGISDETGTGSLVFGTSPTIGTPTISGGTINNTSIGATTRSSGDFTTLSGNTVTATTPVLSFNAANTIASFGSTTASSYNQLVIQNKSNSANASTNYVLSNNLGTDSTYYGEFGMNASTYSAGTPIDFFSINNGIYFSGHDGDITIGSGNGFKTYFAWGTTGQSAHAINASGAIGLNTSITGSTNFGTSGQVLTSGGSSATPTWTTPTTGTVTSVGLSAPALFTVGSSPVTSSGTLALTYSGTALPIANGGTGSTSTTFCSLTTNVSGTLPTANGGTNLTAFTSGGALYATSTSALTTGTLPVASGGTGASTASITSFNNITGYTASGATGTTSTNLVFSTSPTLTTPNIGAATGTSVVLTGAISSSSASAGIGYATGAGEALTQSTSGTTTVVSGNKMTGTITLFSVARAAQGGSTFTFTNTSIGATDHVVITHISAGTLGAYNITATPAAGSASITIRNVNTASLTEAPVLKYTIIKSVVA